MNPQDDRNCSSSREPGCLSPGSYEFAESLERFLLDAARSRPVEKRDDEARADPT
jgi:hypothetical protein